VDHTSNFKKDKVISLGSFLLKKAELVSSEEYEKKNDGNMFTPPIAKKLIINESPYPVSPKVIKKLNSIEEAIFLQQMHYIVNKTPSFVRDGRGWFSCSMGEMERIFLSIFNKRGLERTVKSLREKGLLLITKPNTRRANHTNAYSVDEDKLTEITGPENGKGHHQFLPTLRAIIGSTFGAIFLQQLHYLISQGDCKEVEGISWCYKSIDELSKIFPYVCAKTINRTLKLLKDKNLITPSQHNYFCWDQTISYSIDYETLANLVDIYTKKIKLDNQKHCKFMIPPLCPNGYRHFVPMDTATLSQCTFNKIIPKRKKSSSCARPVDNSVDNFSKMGEEANNFEEGARNEAQLEFIGQSEGHSDEKNQKTCVRMVNKKKSPREAKIKGVRDTKTEDNVEQLLEEAKRLGCKESIKLQLEEYYQSHGRGYVASKLKIAKEEIKRGGIAFPDGFFRWVLKTDHKGFIKPSNQQSVRTPTSPAAQEAIASAPDKVPTTHWDVQIECLRERLAKLHDNLGHKERIDDIEKGFRSIGRAMPVWLTESITRQLQGDSQKTIDKLEAQLEKALELKKLMEE
jgi:hypothetical protein